MKRRSHRTTQSAGTNGCAETPRSIGLEEFFHKYGSEEAIRKGMERFNNGHWELTKALEEYGEILISQGEVGESCAEWFLLSVLYWKNPYVDSNGAIRPHFINHGETVPRLNEVLSICQRGNCDEAVEVAGGIKGFGSVDGNRRMVSALLRFLKPGVFGTVDWRVWALFSNPQFVDDDYVLRGEDPRRKKEIITTEGYIRYLGIIRKIAQHCNITPAEVDMATFTYTLENERKLRNAIGFPSG